MARRFFRKLTPSDEKVRSNKVLRLFGTLLLNRRLWQLNRHSTACGVACGMFWAWIAAPIQTIGAVLFALVGRGNVPLAMAFTFVSNPLTWVPCFWFSYRVGLFVTGQEPMADFEKQISETMNLGFIGGIRHGAWLLIQQWPRLYPMYLGGALVGAVTGAASYVAVKLAWRWNVVRRWQHRHHARRARGFPVKLTSGFAHLARRPGRQGTR